MRLEGGLGAWNSTSACKANEASRAYFDGRAVLKEGAGGFVVFSPSGEYVAGQALFFGQRACTNNEAEAEALV